MDSERRRALSNFYREEFERHLEHLQASGMVTSQAAMRRMMCRFVSDLDHVCCHAEFPALAETLLQHFDTLTRLSEVDPRPGH